MFFVSRHIFDRTSQLEQKTLEKSPKSTLQGSQNRPKSDQNRSSECKLELRRALGGRKRAARAAKDAQESAKRAPRGLSGKPVGVPWSFHGASMERVGGMAAASGGGGRR